MGSLNFFPGFKVLSHSLLTQWECSDVNARCSCRASLPDRWRSSSAKWRRTALRTFL